MIDINPLRSFTLTDFQRIASGYTTRKKYAVTYSEADGAVSFHVQPIMIDISYYTNEDYPDGEVAVFMKRRLD